jgi:NDP-sugar pyrophosphorylase family protein
MRKKYTVKTKISFNERHNQYGWSRVWQKPITSREEKMQAMILAAGFGTRLLPYTQFRPKPLFPILNKPLLLLTIERLQRAGCDHIVVNCHHLQQQIVDILENLKGVVIQREERILGTGGGLRLALRSFRDEPVLVTNGDIFHTVDFHSFYEAHINSAAPVTMAMHDFPRFNAVSVADEQVAGFDNTGNGRLLAFTGLHVIDPDILSSIPLMQPSSIIDHYRWLLNKKKRIAAFRVDGSFWTDMGTVEDYLALHGGLLTGTIPWWQELGEGPESPFFLANRQADNSSLLMREWVCAGEVKIGKDVHLERVILWDYASVPDGSRLKDVLVIQ